MKLTFSKEFPYQFLFALCIILPYFNVYEITFLVWLTAFFLSIKKKYSIIVLKYVFSFAAIIIIAFVVGLYKDYPLFIRIRDFTYLVKPILGILIGYQLCRNHNCKPFQTIIVTGLIIAIVHLIIVFSSVLLYNVRNIHQLRHYGGFFSDYEVYALVIVLFYKKFELQLSRKEFYTAAIIIGLSSFLYLSRTNFIQFAILILAMKGYFVLNKKSLTVIGAFLIAVIIGYSYIYSMNLSRNGTGMEALLYKIKNAPIEAFKTKVDKDDWQDFNDNYRSYENIITVRQVKSEGITGILFGKGMGSTIKLGKRVWTNDGTYITKAAILHNAYFTIFLKSGLVGVLFCFYFIYLLFKQNKTDVELIKNINLLLIGTGVFLVLANWVLLGLYLKLDNKSILLGFILAYKELILKEEKVLNKHE